MNNLRKAKVLTASEECSNKTAVITLVTLIMEKLKAAVLSYLKMDLSTKVISITTELKARTAYIKTNKLLMKEVSGIINSMESV